jgi:hypothetical protein
MAKSSVDHFDLKTIRAMLTAAERKVFDSSLGKQIAAAGREQLQAAIGHARSLRDKWRDLYAAQTRTTKRSAKAGTKVNDRSREKSELFAGAIERFEARLAEVGTAVQAAAKQARKAVTKAVAAPAKPATKLKAARPAPKKVRTAANRQTRAGVKKDLKRATRAANAKR